MSQSQLDLSMDLDHPRRTWGGARRGAGRKPKANKHDSAHRTRPKHVGRYPLHVVLRTCEDVPRLRQPAGYAAINGALKHVSSLTNFRIVHVSLQHNHIHLLVEADNGDALEHGMRAFATSVARRINRAFGRRGKVVAFRYYTTKLTGPMQVRNALVYVLNNWRRHNEDERGLRQREAKLDPYSSAIAFTRWADFRLGPLPPKYIPLKVSPPNTWLLAVGWELANKPIRTYDVPGPLGRVAKSASRRNRSTRRS
jgi:REP element-mobilizing transposase RayT